MKRTELLLLFILISTFSLGQDVYSSTLDVGERAKVKGLRDFPIFIGVNDDKIIAFRENENRLANSYFIEEYDPKTLNMVNESKIVFKYEKHNLRSERQIVFGDKNLFFTSYLNKSTSIRHYFMMEHLEGERFSKPILVGSVDWGNVGRGMLTAKNTTETVLKLAVSENGEKLAVLTPKVLRSKESDLNKWETVLYDLDLNLLSEHTFALENKNLFIDKVFLGNDDIIYCSAIESLHKKSNWFTHYYTNFTIDNYTGEGYYFMKLNLDSKEVVSRKIELDEAMISSYSMTLLDQEIYFYGLTASKNTRNAVNGSFLVKLNNLGEIEYRKMNKFVDAEKENSNRLKIIGRNSFKDFILRDLVKLEDGSLIFLAEQFTYTITVSGQAAGSVEYIFSDIIAISYLENGNYNWMKRIPKRQGSTNDVGYFLSFYSLQKGNSLNLLLNYSKKSIESGNKNIFGRRVLTSIEITSQGQINRTMLSDKKTDNSLTDPAPSSGFLINSELYMFGKKRRNKGVLSSFDGVMCRMKINI